MAVLLIGALLLSTFIIKSFIVPLLASAIIAYIFYPIFRWINKKINSRTISALIVSFFILALITVPIVMVVNTLSTEGYTLYIQGRELLVGGSFLRECTAQPCTTIRNWLGNNQVRLALQKALEGASTYLIENASKLVLTIPRHALEVFITFFAAFYLLRDGDKITDAIKRLLILRDGKKQHIVNRFNDVVYAVVFGSLLVAFIQGLMGAVGFTLFGISSPIFWGMVMFFLALIPYVGTGIVWVPASAILIIDGLLNDEKLLLWKGIGLLIYGFVFIGSIDNILKPRIIGHRSRVHPILVLVGILGGLSLMGLPGIVIGPVILAMTTTLLELYVAPNEES